MLMSRMFRYGHHVDGAGSVIQMETKDFTDLVSFLCFAVSCDGFELREPVFEAGEAWAILFPGVFLV